jgi:hypothetical protein
MSDHRCREAFSLLEAPPLRWGIAAPGEMAADFVATVTHVGPAAAVALATYVAEGRLDSPVHSLDDALSLAETMDSVRAQVRNAAR